MLLNYKAETIYEFTLPLLRKRDLLWAADSIQFNSIRHKTANQKKVLSSWYPGRIAENFAQHVASPP